MSNNCYVYKWTHLPTLKWYVGSRTAKGCHPNDGYICSSRHVKPRIIDNPTEWQKTIVATGTPDEMRQLEAELLDCADAKNDKRSFNLHNGDGKFTTAGKKLGPFTDEHLTNMSKATKGRSNIWAKGKPSWNKGLSGYYKHSDETKKKISEKQRGKNNHMYGKIGILNPNFGKSKDGTKMKQTRLEKYWSGYRCSCILCHKEVTLGTLNNHIKSKFCVGYNRPKMSCICCKKEIWASSRHNHWRLSKCSKR